MSVSVALSTGPPASPGTDPGHADPSCARRVLSTLLEGKTTALRWRWGTAKVAHDVGVCPLTCPITSYSINNAHSAAIDLRT
jgi:hypothetical protein